jgi:hypothetical protein
MNETPRVRLSARYETAIRAALELLEKFGVEVAFVGGVAESAWLGESLDGGSIDMLALVSPDRRRQIPMMAANRGFTVDPEAVEAAAELDLIPLAFGTGDERIPIHILLASNALYAIMIRDSKDATLGESLLRVVRPDDLALLLVVDESEEARTKVSRLVVEGSEAFDVEQFNRRLTSLGLASRRIER